MKTHRRFIRRIALTATSTLTWSSLFGAGAQALAMVRALPKPAGHKRSLSVQEMRRIVGAIAGAPVTSGAPDPWIGSVGGVNTANGGKLTSIPIVGWTNRGGLPVQLTLFHNSLGTINRALGNQWTHSFDIHATVSSGNFTVHWGDERSYTFTGPVNMDGTLNAPIGIYDTLVVNGSPTPTSYDLTTKSQVKYHFVASGSEWVCSAYSDPYGNTVSISRDGSGNVSTVSDSAASPNTRTITFHYDGSSRVDWVKDPMNRQWDITYKTSGEIDKITYPLPGTSGTRPYEQFAYDTGHRITTFTDKRSKNWTFGYNTDGTLAWEKDPISPTPNQISYTYASTYTEMTDSNSHTVRHTYDTSGRLASVTDAANHTEYYTYDTSKNVTRKTDRLGKYWDFTYDSRGNVLTTTDPLSHTTTITYNSKNRVTSVTGPLGNYVMNTYDTTLGWSLMESKKYDAAATALSRVQYTYNTDGTVATKNDEIDQTTTYSYDTATYGTPGHGDLTKVAFQSGATLYNGYNFLGARTKRIDRGNYVTLYERDNWDRVTKIDYPTGTDSTFEYDENSNLIKWTDSIGTPLHPWTRIYDDANRLTYEKLDGVTRYNLAYDVTGKKGLLSTMTDADGRTFTYSYSSRNQLASMVETAGSNTYTASYTYDDVGREYDITNPNGTTVAKRYDDAGRLTSVTNKNSGGATLSSFTYVYNNDNQRTSCTESDGTNTSVASWGYDAAGHMISEGRTGTNAYTSESYELDQQGNRKKRYVGGTLVDTYSYSLDGRLNSVTGGLNTSYTYNDSYGIVTRTTGGTTYTMAYDYEDQLISNSWNSGANVTSFTYDALGRRYSRTAGGVTTQFIWGPQGILLEKQGTSTTATYSYGNALVRKDAEYPLFDGLGSERTVTDNTQAVVGRINYDAFGQVVGTSGSSTNPFMYGATSGYRNDWDGGLYHVGARYYDPQVGRFVTPDSFLDQNPFLYCDHDPVNHLDPSGHDAIYAGGGSAAIIGVLGANVEGGFLFDPITGDVGVSVTGFVGIGYGYGISLSPVFGISPGPIQTGASGGIGAAGFIAAGISGGASGFVPISGGNVGWPSSSGSYKFGGGVGGGAFAGPGGTGTLRLGNLYAFVAAAKSLWDRINPFR